MGGDSFIRLQELKTPWRGECGDCSLRLLTDEVFVSEWEAKNKAEPHPPLLREVIWTFAPRKERLDVLSEESDRDAGASDSNGGDIAGVDNGDESDVGEDGGANGVQT